MCSLVFRRQLLLGIHVLLICICVKTSRGAPVALPNQLRTSTADEGASLGQVQSQGRSENQFLHSDHHVQHRISDSRVHPESLSDAANNADLQPQLLQDGQEHPSVTGQMIKNFSPASSDKGSAVSVSTPDLGDGQNQQHPVPRSGRTTSEDKVSDDLSKQASGDGSRDKQMESGEQRADLQEQINGKIKALSKNMDKSKRLSFFSVLHPALAAALSPGEHEELADIPRPPLDSIEYSSGPLRGTESHDDDALQYPAATRSKQSVLSEIQEVAADSHKFKPIEQEKHQDVEEDLKQSESERLFAIESGKRLDLSGREDSLRSVEHSQPEGSTVAEEIHISSTGTESSGPEQEFKLGVKSVQREARKEADKLPLSGSRAESGHSDAHLSSSGKTTSKLNATKVEEPGGTERVMKTTAQYWHGFVSRVKRVIGALRNPSSTSQASKEHQNDSFTEDDVQDMVNEVVREIQMRAERETQPATGADATSDAREEHGNKEDSKGTLLMLRTKTVVSSDVVADAVTAAAKKMLSEKGDTLSHITSSKLLREVQDKLEELLQPVE